MTHDEMIAVIQAHKDGKQIQYYSTNQQQWFDEKQPDWAFEQAVYRVKPEPRVFYAYEEPDGSYSSCHPDLYAAFKVREVIE